MQFIARFYKNTLNKEVDIATTLVNIFYTLGIITYVYGIKGIRAEDKPTDLNNNGPETLGKKRLVYMSSFNSFNVVR